MKLDCDLMSIPRLAKVARYALKALLISRPVRYQLGNGTEYVSRRSMSIGGCICQVSSLKSLKHVRGQRPTYAEATIALEQVAKNHEFVVFVIDLRKKGFEIEKIFFVPVEDLLVAKSPRGRVLIPVRENEYEENGRSTLDWNKYEGMQGLFSLRRKSPFLGKTKSAAL